MSKKQIVETILSEVKDPALREKLLAQLAAAETGSQGESSIITSELSKLGFDPKAVSDLAGFHLKTSVFIGYLVGGLFFGGGGLISLLNLFAGKLATAVFAGFFAAIGLYALVMTRKFSRLRKSQ